MKTKLRVSILTAAWISILCFWGPAQLHAELMPQTTEIASIENLDKKVSIDFVNANLKDVLKIFTKQTGVNFVLDSSLTTRNISVFLDKVTVRQALKSIAETYNLGFYPVEGTPVLKVREVTGNDSDIRMTKVFKLNYAKVSISRLLTQTDADQEGVYEEQDEFPVIKGSDEDSAEGLEGIVLSVASVLSEDGVMSIDSRTNSIVVTDYPDAIERIEVIIAALDRKPDQVLIKVEMVELTDTLNNIIGLTYGNPSNSEQLVSLNYNSPTANTVYPFDREVLGMFGELIANTASMTSTLAFGTLQAGAFDMVLNAIKTTGKGHFLSRPRIMTVDNEPAVVDITSETAVSQSTTTDDSGNTTVDFERLTTGILLRVTPQVHKDDSVTMLIQPSVTRTSTSTIFPTTALDPFTRSVLTKVRIKQGDTISVGGLLQKDLEKKNSKVPFLGEIPVLGSVFSKKTKTASITDLIVFITPIIVRDQDMKHLQKRPEEELTNGDALKIARDEREHQLQDQKTQKRLKTENKWRMQQNALTSKIEHCRSEILKDPTNAVAYSNLGVSLAKAQQYDDAIEAFKKAVMLDPGSGAAYNNLGNLYRIKREYDAAISCLSRAVELAPDHPFAYTTLGLCYEMKDMFDEARQSYRNAIRYAPDAAWTNTARERLNVLTQGL